MRALGGAATGSAATADPDAVFADSAEEPDEETMDLYDALKQPMPTSSAAGEKEKVLASGMFDLTDDQEDMAMIDEDEDDDTDRWVID